METEASSSTSTATATARSVGPAPLSDAVLASLLKRTPAAPPLRGPANGSVSSLAHLRSLSEESSRVAVLKTSGSSSSSSSSSSSGGSSGGSGGEEEKPWSLARRSRAAGLPPPTAAVVVDKWGFEGTPSGRPVAGPAAGPAARTMPPTTVARAVTTPRRTVWHLYFQTCLLPPIESIVVNLNEDHGRELDPVVVLRPTPKRARETVVVAVAREEDEAPASALGHDSHSPSEKRSRVADGADVVVERDARTITGTTVTSSSSSAVAAQIVFMPMWVPVTPPRTGSTSATSATSATSSTSSVADGPSAKTTTTTTTTTAATTAAATDLAEDPWTVATTASRTIHSLRVRQVREQQRAQRAVKNLIQSMGGLWVLKCESLRALEREGHHFIASVVVPLWLTGGSHGTAAEECPSAVLSPRGGAVSDGAAGDGSGRDAEGVPFYYEEDVWRPSWRTSAAYASVEAALQAHAKFGRALEDLEQRFARGRRRLGPAAETAAWTLSSSSQTLSVRRGLAQVVGDGGSGGGGGGGGVSSDEDMKTLLPPWQQLAVLRALRARWQSCVSDTHRVQRTIEALAKTDETAVAALVRHMLHLGAPTTGRSDFLFPESNLHVFFGAALPPLHDVPPTCRVPLSEALREPARQYMGKQVLNFTLAEAWDRLMAKKRG